MSKFLITLAVAAIAGVMYVAAAPGGQTAGPTAAQFTALKREVSGLKKQLRGVKHLLHDCMASSVPITRRGDWQTPAGPTYGYAYSDPAVNGGTPFAETALDVTDAGDPAAMWITGGTAKCGVDVGTAVRKLGWGGR